LKFTAGTDSTITIKGSAFVNSVVNPYTNEEIVLSSVVEVTDSMGITTELGPASLTPTELTVTIPGNLEPGNYTLQVMKASNGSNPKGIVMSPKVAINSVKANADGTITVTGGGFSGYLHPVAGTSVDPDEFADLALEAGANAILVSTHNGMALTYAKHLLAQIGVLVDSRQTGVFHAVNEGKVSRFDVACELARQISSSTEIIPVPGSEFPTKAPRGRSEALENRRLAELGLNRMPGWKEALAEYLRELEGLGILQGGRLAAD